MTLAKVPVVLSRFVRKLRGGSQSILAEASDGELYVVKFLNNPQGPNLLFNESVGTELYRLAKLAVPCCRRLMATDSFIDQNPTCWMETPEGWRLRPTSGLCFGSIFLGRKHVQLYEIFPATYYQRVTNLDQFWLAWTLDACASHADNRQALFHSGLKGGFFAVFIDHGHMFGGPNGGLNPHFGASRYLDPRLYPHITAKFVKKLTRSVVGLNVDRLWREVKELPDEWQSPRALNRVSESLNTVSCSRIVESTVEALLEMQLTTQESKRNGFLAKRRPPYSVSCNGMHAAVGPQRLA